MGHAGGSHLERTNVPGTYADRLDVKRRGAEAGFGMQRIHTLSQLTGPEHPNASTLSRPPAQVVAKRHEIDEVVGVQVADQDGIEARGVEEAGQTRE